MRAYGTTVDSDQGYSSSKDSPGLPRVLLAAPCESTAVRMVVLRLVFNGFRRKHASRVGERAIQPPWGSPRRLKEALRTAKGLV